MDAPTGQDGPASSTSAVVDPPASSEAIPLSVDDFKAAEPAAPEKGETEARAIFKKLAAKKAQDEPPELVDAEPTPDPKDEGKAQTPPAAAEKPADQPATTAEAGDASLSAARDALIRDGWSGSDLDQLPKERVLALGAKRSTEQKKVDGFGRQKAEELATLRARLTELEGPGNAQANQPSAAASPTANTPAAATADPFADPAMAPIAAELDKLGEYASPEVKEVMKKSLAAMHRISQQQIAQQMQSVHAVAEQQMLGAARVKVAEAFPAIKEQAKFDAVTQKMRVLAKTGAYGPTDMETLMHDACKLTLPAPSIKDVQRQMLEQSRKAIDGQMDAGQSAKDKGEKPVTDTDRNRHILRLMNKGKSADEARRIAFAR